MVKISPAGRNDKRKVEMTGGQVLGKWWSSSLRAARSSRGAAIPGWIF